jgi:hypothetical protein
MRVTSAMLCGVTSSPLAFLRHALANLAADPEEQERRLTGTMVRDELALDFGNAFESLASLPAADRLDDVTMADLGVLYEALSVGPEDPLWSEGLDSARWTQVRSLAVGLISRL